jgi:hypothetical protein
MNKADWIWMPHPAHFIGGRDCQFHLSTLVGDYIVSTVGEYHPDKEVRAIHAKVSGVVIEGRGDEWDYNFFKRFGYMDIGRDRKYETMVFRAKPSEERCCPFAIDLDGGETDFAGYNSAEDATKGHNELCVKWSTVIAPPARDE